MSRAAIIAIILILAARASAQAPPRFEQQIGSQLPLEAVLVDESGRSEPLGNFFGKRPAVLIFGYYSCPQLCSVVERTAVDTLRDLKPSVGRDFDVIYLSIDPADTPSQAWARRAASVRDYGRGDSLGGWHYLTGSEATVRSVAAAAGFNYRYDPVTRLYAHPSGLALVTPRGVISRYFLGVDYPASDMAAALRRAAAEKTGEPVFDLLLECARGDAFSGRYGKIIWRVLEAAVALTVIGVFGGIGWMLRGELGWKNRKEASP